MWELIIEIVVGLLDTLWSQPKKRKDKRRARRKAND